MVHAHRRRRKIESGQARSIAHLAEQEGIMVAYVCRLLPLTRLASDIVEAILDGQQPKELRLAEVPGEWVVELGAAATDSQLSAVTLTPFGCWRRRAVLFSSGLIPAAEVTVDIGAWLRSLGLERYEPVFRDNEIDAEVLPRLTGEDLTDLGVTAVGHRRKLLDAIAALRTPALAPAAAAPTNERAELAPGTSATHPK